MAAGGQEQSAEDEACKVLHVDQPPWGKDASRGGVVPAWSRRHDIGNWRHVEHELFDRMVIACLWAPHTPVARTVDT